MCGYEGLPVRTKQCRSISNFSTPSIRPFIRIFIRNFFISNLLSSHSRMLYSLLTMWPSGAILGLILAVHITARPIDGDYTRPGEIFRPRKEPTELSPTELSPYQTVVPSPTPSPTPPPQQPTQSCTTKDHNWFL